MIELENAEIKILQYINHHPNQTYTQIYKKFPKFKECYHRLESNHMIKSNDPNDNLRGNDYDALNNPTTIQIGRNGTIFLESNKLLTVRYIITSLIIPIIVGVASAVIAALILAA
ncbi:MAG: hypothetical protein HDR18_00815 [Lachnospiraceae bacterium]|nr:hypothetical protein [Lachnospiraceae bacterium]